MRIRADPAQLVPGVYCGRSIENGLHWCLDVSFAEDQNRTRDRNAGANLGAIRRVAAALLQQDPDRGSIKTKRLKAALDPHYLISALQGFPEN